MSAPSHTGDMLMSPWLRYLIAFVVGCHAFIYLRIGPVAAQTIREWTGSSWLASAIAFPLAFSR